MNAYLIIAMLTTRLDIDCFVSSTSMSQQSLDRDLDSNCTLISTPKPH